MNTKITCFPCGECDYDFTECKQKNYCSAFRTPMMHPNAYNRLPAMPDPQVEAPQDKAPEKPHKSKKAKPTKGKK